MECAYFAQLYRGQTAIEWSDYRNHAVFQGMPKVSASMYNTELSAARAFGMSEQQWLDAGRASRATMTGHYVSNNIIDQLVKYDVAEKERREMEAKRKSGKR